MRLMQAGPVGLPRHVFGVSVSSAIRWVARDRERGDLEPDKRGGNTRSHRIDAHRELIMSWIEEGARPDA